MITNRFVVIALGARGGTGGGVGGGLLGAGLPGGEGRRDVDGLVGEGRVRAPALRVRLVASAAEVTAAAAATAAVAAGQQTAEQRETLAPA